MFKPFIFRSQLTQHWVAWTPRGMYVEATHADVLTRVAEYYALRRIG